MHLNTGAVHLVFEGRFAEFIERFVDVAGGLREHRLDGPKQLDAVLVEAFAPAFQNGARNRRDVAGHHRGTPHFRERNARRFADTFGHETFQRTLPEFTYEERCQKALLLLGRGGVEIPDQLAPAALGSGAADLR